MVSMMSTFAMRWFMPRLTRFQHKHPNIEIQTSSTMRPMGFEREDLDAAIRNGAGKWAQWFEHLNVPPEQAVQKLTFETTDLSLATGTKGLGIAIVDRHNVEEGVESDRLMILFEPPMRLPESHFLVCSKR
jgi:DNA-binding transcriptional LysR family regulator